MVRSDSGFSVVEILVAVLFLSVVVAGSMANFTSQDRTYQQQDLTVSMQENLRTGMELVTDTLRTTGYGVPAANFNKWFKWMSNFNSNPSTQGASGSPNFSLSVASCFQAPVATLASRALVGATTLSLTSNVPGTALSSLLDTNSNSLIFIGDAENAVITAVSGSSFSIDTDPTTPGNQGLTMSYPAGTPICRVDVYAFTINTDPSTGIPALGLNPNQGSGSQFEVQGISGLGLTTVVANKQYQATVSAQSDGTDPTTNAYLSGTLSSNVSIKN